MQPAPDIHLNDPGPQKQGFSVNLERNSYQLYDIKLRNKVKFDIQPTNPQADIAATGSCECWITDVNLMKHQGNDTEFPSDDPKLPEVYTATIACIHNVDRKCKGMLTPERLNILQRAFEKAKYSGLQHSPPPFDSCIGACGPRHTQKYCYLQTCKPKDLKTRYHICFPPTPSPPYKNESPKKKRHPPLTMTPRSPNTRVNVQEIRPLGQTATPSHTSSLIPLFAIPFTMKTPCI